MRQFGLGSGVTDLNLIPGRPVRHAYLRVGCVVHSDHRPKDPLRPLYGGILIPKAVQRRPSLMGAQYHWGRSRFIKLLLAVQVRHGAVAERSQKSQQSRSIQLIRRSSQEATSKAIRAQP